MRWLCAPSRSPLQHRQEPRGSGRAPTRLPAAQARATGNALRSAEPGPRGQRGGQEADAHVDLRHQRARRPQAKAASGWRRYAPRPKQARPPPAAARSVARSALQDDRRRIDRPQRRRPQPRLAPRLGNGQEAEGGEREQRHDVQRLHCAGQVRRRLGVGQSHQAGEHPDTSPGWARRRCSACRRRPRAVAGGGIACAWKNSTARHAFHSMSP